MFPTPCLLTGAYDWSDAAAPRAEYDERLARVREKMRARGVGRLAVHGNAFDHAALAWLTHFTPKLGPAFAFVAMDSPLQLRFSGGPGMRTSQQLLTSIEDVTPLRDAADVAKWLADGALKGLMPGLVEGAAMLQGTWAGIAASLAAGLTAESGDTRLTLMDEDIDPLRRIRSPSQVSAVTRAIEILSAATRTASQFNHDKSRRDFMIATEAAAYAHGAQDARILVSSRAFGPPQPLGDDAETISVPAQARIAVRYAGQWAQGCVTIGETSQFMRMAACRQISAALASLHAGSSLRAGSSLDPDPCIAINGIGLNLKEAPRSGETLIDGDILNIVATLREGEHNVCAFSALARIQGESARLLWASPELQMNIPRQ